MDKKQRLLDKITPTNYAIHLTPNIKKFTFSGEARIDLTIQEPTHVISLHAVDLNIQNATVTDAEKNVYAADISYDKKAKSVMFSFPQQLPSGNATLVLSFTGVVNEQLKGWYKSAYEVNGETRYLITSHFEETDARRVFPCIDDPSAKAIFQFTLSIPKELMAITNTLPENTKEEGDTKTITFAPTPKMSTYPLALIVGEFEYIEDSTETGVLIRILVTPGKKHLARFALSTATKTLAFYEKYFGIPYPLPKLDFIAVPDFDAGAMENWGAVTAREAALLIDEQKSAAVIKQWVATVIAHEVSHMWFGDLVTLEWWTYLWLNEGFASYMEYFAVDALFPEWKVWEHFAILDHNRALGLDSLNHTHPVETEVKNMDTLAENFDEISYSKGASVIYMLAAFLGEEDFRKGVQEYLKKFAYGNATTEDLWESLEKVSGKPVRDIMHNFIMQPGHPIVFVGEKPQLQLSQQRFFINSVSMEKSADTTIWKIPFAVVSPDKHYEKEYLMEQKTLHLPSLLENDWIKVNRDETSYVRGIYSGELYHRLEKPIQEKKLSSIDRMGIIRDAFDGAEAGLTSTVFALELATSYTQEDAYIVWASLSGKLSKVANLLATTEVSSAFDTYVRKLVTPIGQKLGWEKKPSDTHSGILLRSIALYMLGSHGDSLTIEKAHQLFANFIAKGTPIDNDIRGVVYRLVAETGGEKEFEIFQRLYKEEPLHEEKNRIGGALIAFKNPDLVTKALEFSLSKHVRAQDIGRFIMAGFDNVWGKDATWKFVKKNWDELVRIHAGQIGMDWLIKNAAYFTTEEKRKEIQDFFTAHPTPQLERTIQQVLEQIQSNIAWLERDGQKIRDFLNKQIPQ